MGGYERKTGKRTAKERVYELNKLRRVEERKTLEVGG